MKYGHWVYQSMNLFMDIESFHGILPPIKNFSKRHMKTMSSTVLQYQNRLNTSSDNVSIQETNVELLTCLNTHGSKSILRNSQQIVIIKLLLVEEKEESEERRKSHHNTHYSRNNFYKNHSSENHQKSKSTLIYLNILTSNILTKNTQLNIALIIKYVI